MLPHVACHDRAESVGFNLQQSLTSCERPTVGERPTVAIPKVPYAASNSPETRITSRILLPLLLPAVLVSTESIYSPATLSRNHRTALTVSFRGYIVAGRLLDRALGWSDGALSYASVLLLDDTEKKCLTQENAPPHPSGIYRYIGNSWLGLFRLRVGSGWLLTGRQIPQILQLTADPVHRKPGREGKFALPTEPQGGCG